MVCRAELVGVSTAQQWCNYVASCRTDGRVWVCDSMATLRAMLAMSGADKIVQCVNGDFLDADVAKYAHMRACVRACVRACARARTGEHTHARTRTVQVCGRDRGAL